MIGQRCSVVLRKSSQCWRRDTNLHLQSLCPSLTPPPLLFLRVVLVLLRLRPSLSGVSSLLLRHQEQEVRANSCMLVYCAVIESPKVTGQVFESPGPVQGWRLLTPFKLHHWFMNPKPGQWGFRGHWPRPPEVRINLRQSLRSRENTTTNEHPSWLHQPCPQPRLLTAKLKNHGNRQPRLTLIGQCRLKVVPVGGALRLPWCHCCCSATGNHADEIQGRGFYGRCGQTYLEVKVETKMIWKLRVFGYAVAWQCILIAAVFCLFVTIVIRFGSNFGDWLGSGPLLLIWFQIIGGILDVQCVYVWILVVFNKLPCEYRLQGKYLHIISRIFMMEILTATFPTGKLSFIYMIKFPCLSHSDLSVSFTHLFLWPVCLCLVVVPFMVRLPSTTKLSRPW